MYLTRKFLEKKSAVYNQERVISKFVLTCIRDLPLLNYEITSIGKAKLGGGRLKISANVHM